VKEAIDGQVPDHYDRLADHELQLVYQRQELEAAYHQATDRWLVTDALAVQERQQIVARYGRIGDWAVGLRHKRQRFDYAAMRGDPRIQDWLCLEEQILTCRQEMRRARA
jgi:hypothetical protein